MSLRDRIEDFIDNVDEIQIAILLVSLIIGTATAIGVSSNKSELKNTNFEVKEAPVLAKFSEQNIGGSSHSISTNYDYRFILDIDEDGLYNKNKDIVIYGDNIPYYLLEKDNRIVYLEVTRKDNVLRRSPLVVKDKEEKSHLVSEVEDFYNIKFWKKNESFNKTNQIFKDKYMNQR
ncbi:MAG: hypothetical protein IJ473_02990 [Alphaproteobacteria bacterium]|nr:hypothetical protein [Alphaproteobacteria bacterium]